MSGVGQNKFQRYGEIFIKEIRDFTQGKREKMYFGELEEAEKRVWFFGTEKGRKASSKKGGFLSDQGTDGTDCLWRALSCHRTGREDERTSRSARL